MTFLSVQGQKISGPVYAEVGTLPSLGDSLSGNAETGLPGGVIVEIENDPNDDQISYLLVRDFSGKETEQQWVHDTHGGFWCGWWRNLHR